MEKQKNIEVIIEEKTREFDIELTLNNSIYCKNKNNPKEKVKTEEYTDNEKIKMILPIEFQPEVINNSMLLSNNENFSIKVKDLIQCLQLYGYPIFPRTKLYIYIKYIDTFVFVDSQMEYINSAMFSENNSIKLKLKNTFEHTLITDTFSLMKNHFLNNLEPENNIKYQGLNDKTIEDVVNLVYRNRMLLYGFIDEKGKFKYFNLNDASKIIKVKKRKLDYAYKKIIFARKAKFNFNMSKHEKFSVLTKFNKAHGFKRKKGKH